MKESNVIEIPIPKLTREQRRMRDRINADANSTFVMLAEKFRVCFMENQPESEAVQLKRKEVNAKWRIYCKNRNLIPEAYTNVSTFCDSLFEQYKSEFDDTVQI